MIACAGSAGCEKTGATASKIANETTQVKAPNARLPLDLVLCAKLFTFTASVHVLSL
jgi:hypothetical protein